MKVWYMKRLKNLANRGSIFSRIPLVLKYPNSFG